MTTYEEWEKSYRRDAEEAERNRPTLAGAAGNLAQHVGPGMWSTTRSKLEQLANCGDPHAEHIARDALNAQKQLYDPSDEYDNTHD